MEDQLLKKRIKFIQSQQKFKQTISQIQNFQAKKLNQKIYIIPPSKMIELEDIYLKNQQKLLKGISFIGEYQNGIVIKDLFTLSVFYSL